jgi:amidase
MPYPQAGVTHAATGPLSGLHFAVKDLFDVAGYPTSAGNPLMLALSGIQRRTAPTVQKLLDAGAAFVGKTITDELAFSMNGNNAHFGAPRNGADAQRITGGSSSGSAAAVSHGLCDFALGTDTGGSVRAPASHCGLYGLRPTHGAVSLSDAVALSPSFDTCGWLTRDAETFARVADVLLPAAATPQAASADHWQLLWPSDVWALLAAAATPSTEAAAQKVIGALGPARPLNVAMESFDAMYWHFRHIQGREAWMSDGAFIQRYAPPLGPGVAERFAWSAQVSDEQVAAATTFRARFTAHLEALLGTHAALLLPTMPDIAPLKSEPESALEDYRNRAIRMLCISGLSGLPQLSLPLAGHSGAPMGLSLLGPRGSDRALVALAQRLHAESRR